MDGVARSIRVRSTSFWQFVEAVGFTLGGLVAGEGSFCTARATPYRNGDARTRFLFVVNMADRDLSVLRALREFLGVGSINVQPSRRPNWQPVAEFSVRSHRAHRAVTIPFAERFLLPSAKRRQFEAWRDALYAYEVRHPNRFGLGPSPCRIDGCSKPVRGRGLCRSHYYRATGH